MLLIIHNLPRDVRALDVKQLIQEQCGLREIILDNLTDEGAGKRVTVGLAEEGDAAILTRKMNGMLYKNCTLYVEDVREKKLIQSYQTSIPSGLQPPLRQPLIQYPMQTQQPHLMTMNYNNMPYYMTQNSSTIMNTGKNTDNQTNHSKQTYHQTQSAYQAFNEWAYPNNVLYPNKTQDSLNNVTQTYLSYQNNRESQSARSNDNKNNWRDNKATSSKRHENFGNFNERKSRSEDRRNSGWEGREDIRSGRDRKDDRSRNRERSRSRDGRNFDQARRSNRSDPRDRDFYERQTGREFIHDHRDRQRERGNDQRERTNHHEPRQIKNERNQKNFFWSKTPLTFSSDPNNSTFTKSNRSTSVNATCTIGYGKNENKMQFNQPTKQMPQSQLDLPPAKRSRFNSNLVSVPIKKVNPPSKSNIIPNEPNSERMIMRYKNWRSQSATLLAKQIIRIGSTSKLDNYVFKAVLKKLRECIDSRLDVIMGDRIAISLDEIIRGYRSQFPVQNDGPFFKAVLEKVEREIAEDGKETDGSSKHVQGQQSTPPNPNQNVPGGKMVSENQRLLKYPTGGKQEIKKMKKNQLLEHQEDYYKLEPVLQKAVDEEIDQLVQCYINACEQSNDEREEIVKNKLLTKTVNEFKKVIKIHVTKRVLDITDGLCVRIFSARLPQRDDLDAFLQRHGVISFKKSETSKMYIAHCDSYENYDRLLSAKSATFSNNASIQMKPLHVTGPPDKKFKGTKYPVRTDNEINEIDLTDFNEIHDDSDVMFIENEENEVVVVHDESFNIGKTTDIENGEINDMETIADDGDDSQKIDASVEESKEDNENVQHLPANEEVNKEGEKIGELTNITEIEETLPVSDNNEVSNSLQTVRDPITMPDDKKDVDNDENAIENTMHDCNSGNEQTEINDSTKNLDNSADNSNSEITNVASNSNMEPEENDTTGECDLGTIDDILNTVDEIDEDDLEDF